MKDHQYYIYYNEYLRAIKSPLRQLQETFNEETKALLGLCRGKKVLAVGCGADRDARALVPLCREFLYVDNDKRLVGLSKDLLGDLKNVSTRVMDVALPDIPDKTFDICFCTYNLIGSIEKKGSLVKGMCRVSAPGGSVILFYWKQDRITTEFLKLYYPSIDIKILSITSEGTQTDKGTFERLNPLFIERMLSHEGLHDITTTDIGPVWYMTKGVK